MNGPPPGDRAVRRADPSLVRPASASGSADPIPSRPDERVDVRREFPEIRAVVAITGAASNTGKTWLVESLLGGLRAAGRTACALKVTRTHLGDCPRGVDTCHTCDSLVGAFQVIDDPTVLATPGKDTGRYVRAGAHTVLWLLVSPTSVAAGLRAALRRVPAGSVLVAEGNSFRDYASADVSLMALGARGELKASAQAVTDRIDAFVRHRDARSAPPATPGGRPLIAPDEAWAFVRDRLDP